MICPDIYFPNFMEWCGKYVRNGNPLFIPEMAASSRAAGNAVYAISQFGAIGCGPFSIENMSLEREREIRNCYDVLSGLSGMILDCQAEGKILGLSPQIGFDWSVEDQPQKGNLGGIVFEGQFDKPVVGGSGTTTALPTLGMGRWGRAAGDAGRGGDGFAGGAGGFCDRGDGGDNYICAGGWSGEDWDRSGAGRAVRQGWNLGWRAMAEWG